MKKYRIIGASTTIEYREIVVEANSREDAIEIINSELEDDAYSYSNWEIDEAKQLDDFEIVEVKEIKPTSQHSS
jgi:hypothetical protein